MRLSSMLSLGMLVGGAVLLSAAPAEAQLPLSNPVITVTMLSPTQSMINLDAINNNVFFQLQWSASYVSTGIYMYELTFDVAPTTTTISPQLVPLAMNAANNNGDNPGMIRAPNYLYNFSVTAREIVTKSADPNLPIPKVNDKSQFIALYVYPSSNMFANPGTMSSGWRFRYDTSPPPAPSITQVSAGEQRLGVNWAAPTTADAGDVNTYDVLLCPDVRSSVPAGTSTTSVKLETLPCSNPIVVASNIPNTQLSASVDGNGLANGIPAAIAVRAVDQFGNKGDPSNIVVATPIHVIDFWNLYKSEGGAEKGGFCFVATAAYGSYAHPVVRALRWFRDRVLKVTPGGTALVWLYYHLSPPLAKEVGRDPGLAAWARLTLIPVALAGLAWMAAPIGGVVLAWRLGRRALGRRGVELREENAGLGR